MARAPAGSGTDVSHDRRAEASPHYAMPHPNSKRAKASKKKRAEEKRAATSDDRGRADARRSAKAEQNRQLEVVRRRRQRLRRARSIGGGALAIVVVGMGAWWAFRPPPEVDGVERPPNLGRGHITGATYGDFTPTSGAHSAAAPSCGVYSEPLPLDGAVHALEHGVVVLWYQAGLPELGADLVSATSGWDSHVIIAPSDSISAPIVATAWNRRKHFSAADDGLEEFVATYRKRGPESVPCDV